MRVFVFELTVGKLRDKVDQKMVDDLRDCLEPDELCFLQMVATDNTERLTRVPTVPDGGHHEPIC